MVDGDGSFQSVVDDGYRAFGYGQVYILFLMPYIFVVRVRDNKLDGHSKWTQMQISAGFEARMSLSVMTLDFAKKYISDAYRSYSSISWTGHA